MKTKKFSRTSTVTWSGMKFAFPKGTSIIAAKNIIAGGLIGQSIALNGIKKNKEKQKLAAKNSLFHVGNFGVDKYEPNLWKVSDTFSLVWLVFLLWHSQFTKISGLSLEKFLESEKTFHRKNGNRAFILVNILGNSGSGDPAQIGRLCKLVSQKLTEENICVAFMIPLLVNYVRKREYF